MKNVFHSLTSKRLLYLESIIVNANGMSTAKPITIIIYKYNIVLHKLLEAVFIN